MGFASSRSSGLIGPHPFTDLSERRVASQDGDDHHELRCGNAENAWFFKLLCVIERPGRGDDGLGGVRIKR
jgi:hypothetical protein